MRQDWHIIRIGGRLGSFLSAFLVVLALILSPLTVADAHDTPHQAVTEIVAVQTQSPACHSSPSCVAFVAPSKLSQSSLKSSRRLRFALFEASLPITCSPGFDTPPPRA